MILNIKVNGTWTEVPAIKGSDGVDGTNGTNGTNGTTPVRGTDYQTAADQTAIVNAVLAALPAAESVSV